MRRKRTIEMKQIGPIPLSKCPTIESYNEEEFLWLVNYSSIGMKTVDNLHHVYEDAGATVLKEHKGIK